MNVNDLSKFFYIIDGGMLLHRLKCQTAKINVLCKKLTENSFQCSQAESDADRLIVQSTLVARLSSCSCCKRAY
jgi:hypothetical protein